MEMRQYSSKIVGFAVAVSALSLSFGGWALASNGNPVQNTGQANTAPAAATKVAPVPEGGTRYGDDVYKVENGTVYEYDDGRWEPQRDKKIENGVVYDFDDGRWEVEYDPNAPVVKQKVAPKVQKTAAPKVNKQKTTAPKAQKSTTPKAQKTTAPQATSVPKVTPAAPAQNVAPQANTLPTSKYKVDNGVVYEYDDGRWEAERDKKIENGVVYEYDDGRWEVDNDRDDDWDDDDRDDDWDD